MKRLKNAFNALKNRKSGYATIYGSEAAMSHQPELNDKHEKQPENTGKHPSEHPKPHSEHLQPHVEHAKPHPDNELPVRRAQRAPAEPTFEPGEPLETAVAYCIDNGAPPNPQYLDHNDESTIAAAHQYYNVRFTLLAADIPPDPNAPPPDPLNPNPPVPKDRVYQIAAVTLIDSPGRAVDGMEQQGLIVHPTPAEIRAAAAQSEFLKMPRPRPRNWRQLEAEEPPLLAPGHESKRAEAKGAEAKGAEAKEHDEHNHKLLSKK